MGRFCLTVVLIFFSGMIGCTRNDSGRQDGAAARKAGREAYHASQAAKRDAKQAARQLERAGKDFRQGWSEAKHEDETRHRGK